LSNEFRFSTKQASNGTGLIDFGYRHYDPQTARWTQRDPLRLDGAVNLYGYCFGHPAGFVDPDGLKARTVGGAAAEFVAFTGGGALGGSVFGPVGTVVGGLVGAGLWALQQFATDHEDYIEDMSPAEAASTLVMDFCYGAVGGYLGGYAYATVSTAYAYYTAGYVAGSTAVSSQGASSTASRGGRLANQIGAAGETAYGIPAGPKTPITIPSTGGTRFPDLLNTASKRLVEVKNCCQLNFTRQLHDYAKYAEAEGLDFVLVTRQNTELSGPLQTEIDIGRIIQEFLPW